MRKEEGAGGAAGGYYDLVNEGEVVNNGGWKFFTFITFAHSCTGC